MPLPDATPTPCSQCPWRRKSAPGWLGPMSPEEWLEAAHSDIAIACHQRIHPAEGEHHGDWDDPMMRQCRGVAIFRANVLKSPRDPEVAVGPQDKESVFAWNDEFLAHHQPNYDKFYKGARDG